MKGLLTTVAFILITGGTLAACGGQDQDREVVLATTTSLQDSGLLDELRQLFEEQTDYDLTPVSVGTGAALEMGARGDADVVLVHSPEAERLWMDAGNGAERVLVMYNDFVIVGSPDDPAGVREARSVVDALRAIADYDASWVSRDDNSGTDELSRQLWADAGIDPVGEGWFIRSGQGMGATLALADQRRAYTLTDRGTWLAVRDRLDLEIMVEGDPALLNLYHVMPVNPQQHPDLDINIDGAEAFVEFLTSEQTQRVIAEYGVDTYGEPLFYPAADSNEDALRASPPTPHTP